MYGCDAMVRLRFSMWFGMCPDTARQGALIFSFIREAHRMEYVTTNKTFIGCFSATGLSD